MHDGRRTGSVLYVTEQKRAGRLPTIRRRNRPGEPMRNHPARIKYDQLEGTLTSISAELGAVLLDTLGLAAAIEWHMRRYQKRTGIPCELTVNSAAGFDLPEECAATIFDIYSEALGNVARHARASRVAIGLAVTPHEITMVVSDNGIGIGKEALAAEARGIAAIRERARVHAGFCEFAGVRNAGTTVTVSLPLAAAA